MRTTHYPKNILLVKNRALGDSIMGLSSISYIKSVLKQSKVTYALPSWIVPFYQNIGTEADDYLELSFNGMGDYYKLWKEVRNKNYDLIIELNQRGSSANFFKFYSLMTRTPYYFHNHNDAAKNKIPIKASEERLPNIQRDLNGVWSILQQKYDLNRPVPSYLDFTPTLKCQIKTTKKIVLGVVATRQTKMWPLEYYKNLANLIIENHPEIKVVIPLSNSELDQNIKKVLQNIGISEKVEFLQAPIQNLAQELSSAFLYIGNDTGLKHICVSLGIKTYTFFGPEEPLEWHPYDEIKHPFFFVTPLECRTKISHYCALNTCDSMICLNKFMPNDIYGFVASEIEQFENENSPI